jgi:hypothetical protein
MRDIVAELPRASDYMLSGVTDIVRLHQRKSKEFFRPSEVMMSEYMCAPFHILHFGLCSILLSDRTDEQIVEELVRPVFDLTQICEHRDKACQVAAEIAGSMTTNIGELFWRALMKRPHSRVGVSCARKFLVYARIDVFLDIALKSRELIGGDSAKIVAYVKAMTPSVPRLKGAEGVGTEMLCGWLTSLTDEVAKDVQEMVVDAFVLVYMSLKLQGHQIALTKAMSAQNFPEDMRFIITASMQAGKSQAQAWANDSYK